MASQKDDALFPCIHSHSVGIEDKMDGRRTYDVDDMQIVQDVICLKGVMLKGNLESGLEPMNFEPLAIKEIIIVSNGKSNN